MEELELDCKHVLNFICADSVFDGLMHTEVPVDDAVSEAFRMLNTPDSEQRSLRQGMSPHACMVVSILVQWFVRYLCKRLIQVMTPEALTIHRGKIASTYITNYLQFQVHFSLKTLISTFFRTLQIDGDSRLVDCIYNMKYVKVCHCATKSMLCSKYFLCSRLIITLFWSKY